MTDPLSSSPPGRIYQAAALLAWCFTVALSWPVAADASPIATGSSMPMLSLRDQHDKPAPVGPATRWVVFTAEKPVSDMVSAVLTAEPAGVVDRLRPGACRAWGAESENRPQRADFLPDSPPHSQAMRQEDGEKAAAAVDLQPATPKPDRLLVYVADISGMPALVTRMFALPKLRELPFPIALVREPAQAAQVSDIPRTSGNATVLRLEDGRVTQVATARQAAELRALLGLPARPDTP